MTNEAREAVEAINKTLHDFKGANDKALAEKADKGYVDSALAEGREKAQAAALGKMDAFNAEAKKRFDDMEAMLDRLNLTGGGSSGSDLTAEAAEFSKHVGGSVSPEEYKAYTEAFDGYLRLGDGRKAPQGAAGTLELSAAMSSGSDPAGGDFVPAAQSRRIATKVFETSPIRQVSTIEVIGTDALEGDNDLEEASSGWVGETESRPETGTPTVGRWRIPVQEQYAMPKDTQKNLDDAARDVEAWLARKVSEKFARGENTGFVTGDGEKRPRGFLTRTFVSTDDATRAWGDVQYIPTGVSGDFAAAPDGWDVFITVIGKVKAPYRQGAVWIMSRSTLAAVMKEKDSNGQYFWTADLTNNNFGFRVLNFPVVEAEDMPVIASDSLSIVFGDMKAAYTIVERAGITVLRDPFTQKGSVLFYTTKRVGGDALNFEAYKAIKFSAS